MGVSQERVRSQSVRENMLRLLASVWKRGKEKEREILLIARQQI